MWPRCTTPSATVPPMTASWVCRSSSRGSSQGPSPLDGDTRARTPETSRELWYVLPVSVFGARVLGKEDGRLVAGRARYVSDVELARMLHVAFVRIGNTNDLRGPSPSPSGPSP